MEADLDKVLIVEGVTDKKKVAEVLAEELEIICTNGTISITRLDELADRLEGRDVYILVDADESGQKLRRQLTREFPNAVHLHIDRIYREVADSPAAHLAAVLLSANLEVKMDNFLKRMTERNE